MYPLHRTQTEIYQWRVRYYRYLVNTTSRATAGLHDKHLESFFQKFPNKLSFLHIAGYDVSNYAAMRKIEGKSKKWITFELSTLRQFFDFYTRLTKSPLHNPFAPRNMLRYRPTKHRLLLKHVSRIIEAAREDPQDALFVKLLLVDGLTGKQIFEQEKDGRLKGYCSNADGMRIRWRRICWKAEVPVPRMTAARGIVAHYGAQCKAVLSFADPNLNDCLPNAHTSAT